MSASAKMGWNDDVSPMHGKIGMKYIVCSKKCGQLNDLHNLPGNDTTMSAGVVSIHGGK